MVTVSRHTTAAVRAPRAVISRRRATALMVLLALAGVAFVAVTALTAKATRPDARLLIAGRVIGRIAPSGPAPSLPATVTVRGRGVTTVYGVDRERGAALLARRTGSDVRVPARPLSVSIAAPPVAQRLRDNCETAALQVLLATTGVRVDQLALQRRLSLSGTPEPQASAAGPVWGDPDAGYVGNADGSGSWGGFGVYQGPIARLAARYGRRMRDLSGAQPASVYRTLLGGRAVMAWIGLGDGPYRDWITPDGRAIRVNLNEHTVVLTGVRRDGSLELVNVLQGTREVWSRARFEQAWALLGQRALATT